MSDWHSGNINFICQNAWNTINKQADIEYTAAPNPYFIYKQQ